MSGKLVLIVGPMRSSKSLHLLDNISSYKAMGKKTVIFKHSKDDRILHEKNQGKQVCESRIGTSAPATFVSFASEILDKVKDEAAVGIEEGEFFDAEIVIVVDQLLKRGADVYIAGLSRDFAGRPFGEMGTLLAIADEIIFLKAVCDVCKKRNATRTQRLLQDGGIAPLNSPQTEVGDKQYVSRCEKDWVQPV